jgi:hypothetical protein
MMAELMALKAQMAAAAPATAPPVAGEQPIAPVTATYQPPIYQAPAAPDTAQPDAGNPLPTVADPAVPDLANTTPAAAVSAVSDETGKEIVT